VATGVTWGAGWDVVFRVYDKLRELVDQPNESKAEVLRERWGAVCGSYNSVVRYEAQFRSKVLREQGIESVGDYLGARGRLMEWFGGYYLRMTAEIPDRANRHQDRAATAEWWAWIVEQWRRWGAGACRERKPIERVRVSGERLVAQAVGVLQRAYVGAVGIVDGEIPGVIEWWSWVRETLPAWACRERERFADGMARKAFAWIGSSLADCQPSRLPA
jgi:hypothetical protein